MDKQQIERMGQTIQMGLKKADSKNEYAGKYPYSSIQMLCIIDELIAAGYGDTQAAVKAFASKVKELIHGFENISQSTDDCLCEKIDELMEEYGNEV